MMVIKLKIAAVNHYIVVDLAESRRSVRDLLTIALRK